MKTLLLLATLAGLPNWAKDNIVKCQKTMCTPQTVTFPGPDGGTYMSGPMLCLSDGQKHDCNERCLVRYCELDGGCMCGDLSELVQTKDGGK